MLTNVGVNPIVFVSFTVPRIMWRAVQSMLVASQKMIIY